MQTSERAREVARNRHCEVHVAVSDSTLGLGRGERLPVEVAAFEQFIDDVVAGRERLAAGGFCRPVEVDDRDGQLVHVVGRRPKCPEIEGSVDEWNHQKHGDRDLRQRAALEALEFCGAGEE